MPDLLIYTLIAFGAMGGLVLLAVLPGSPAPAYVRQTDESMASQQATSLRDQISGF